MTVYNIEDFTVTCQIHLEAGLQGHEIVFSSVIGSSTFGTLAEIFHARYVFQNSAMIWTYIILQKENKSVGYCFGRILTLHLCHQCRTRIYEENLLFGKVTAKHFSAYFFKNFKIGECPKWLYIDLDGIRSADDATLWILKIGLLEVDLWQIYFSPSIFTCLGKAENGFITCVEMVWGRSSPIVQMAKSKTRNIIVWRNTS